jgi:hypothetical protein
VGNDFTPFKLPTEPGDTPLVQWNIHDYKCTGCGQAANNG